MFLSSFRSVVSSVQSSSCRQLSVAGFLSFHCERVECISHSMCMYFTAQCIYYMGGGKTIHHTTSWRWKCSNQQQKNWQQKQSWIIWTWRWTCARRLFIAALALKMVKVIFDPFLTPFVTPVEKKFVRFSTIFAISCRGNTTGKYNGRLSPTKREQNSNVFYTFSYVLALFLKNIADITPETL